MARKAKPNTEVNNKDAEIPFYNGPSSTSDLKLANLECTTTKDQMTKIVSRPIGYSGTLTVVSFIR